MASYQDWENNPADGWNVLYNFLVEAWENYSRRRSKSTQRRQHKLNMWNGSFSISLRLELLEIIRNLYKRNVWPKNYRLSYQHKDNVMNEIRIDVEKERPMTDEELDAKGVTNGYGKTFEPVRFLQLEKSPTTAQTMEVRKLDTEMVQFFDELIAALAEYADLHEHKLQPTVNEQKVAQDDTAKSEKASTTDKIKRIQKC